MLQTLRTQAAGTVAKVLFSILVLSFAVWGVGDYAFLRRTELTALTVAGVTVTQTELSEEYRRELDRLRRSLGEVDPELARQFGLVDRVVERVVARHLFGQSAANLGVRVGDDLVRMRILNDPALQGPGGQFDRNTFLDLLRQANYTEDRFVNLIRDEIARALMTEPVAAGIEVPDAIVDRLYRYRNEKRTAETLFVGNAAFTDIGEPPADAIKALYEDDPERFTAPEYRGLTIVRIGPEEMIPTIEITAEAARAEYDRQLEELRVPEKRQVEQILVRDEATAKAAHEKLVAGGDFIDVAQEIAKQAPEATNLGLISQTALPPELGSAVFELESGRFTEPLKSAFGWHLFRVTRIDPATEPAFEDVEPRIRLELARLQAGEAAVKSANQLEDALGERRSLEEAALAVGVPVISVSEVDYSGRGSDGLLVPILAGAQEVLNAGFEPSQEGRESAIIETRAGVYYVVRVDRIVPARLKPLDEVRAEVEGIWRERKRDEAAKTTAEKILEDARAGKALDALATERGLKVESTPPLRRTLDTTVPAGLTADVLGQIFRLKTGETALATGRQGYYVLRLLEVIAADPAADATGLATLRAELRQRMAGDVGEAMTTAMRNRLGVTIDQDVVKTIQ